MTNSIIKDITNKRHKEVMVVLEGAPVCQPQFRVQLF